MLLDDVADASAQVAATRSRLAKRAVLVDVLRRVAADGPDDVAIVSRYLGGELRQRRTGLGWRSLASMPGAAEVPSLSVHDVDAAFAGMAVLAGPGSATARTEAARALFAAATEREQHLLRGLVSGELRQGALDALLLDAVAEAAGVPADVVRRAAMLAGETEAVAVAALGAASPDDARTALDAFALTVGRPVRPMLAQSAPDVPTAVAQLGERAGTAESPAAQVVVDTKLDGIRIQVHRDGDDVRVWTRSLDDITARVPEIVAAVRGLPARALVLDGEALALDADGRPRPFQETASRSATRDAELAGSATLTPFFFDVLHVDGRDLLDAPLRERLAVLDQVAAPHVVARVVTADPAVATEHFRAVVAAGQEGVVVKAADAPYEAGRRGAAWVKVKPRHTLDLVVLAVERGSGRRAGTLSNIHLGARDPATGGFVMLGKTFKGMTDEMLAWQTQRFRELEVADDGWTVTLRPEQVVEIAFDGLQRSTRYPGGLALRFARVLRYRDDKPAAEADTIETVHGYLT
ncbi:DNA ligase I, ATP-dependent Dnl1 [Cellulomonas flavigena DSM 20109]|uniref:Probable DNA ligase n=1 Tax=Cellulomonas flavigena (strain ATCC 482 / DSM 20109 / BCRC 11376 / JCM 18109 / NBRC 3775 / NCIMB 8073 / NRS 134) TaxID=446466 RepID=D5UKM3_CELFN|nr:ATP-dependent DNA ligase [Cellulomonas flavigena]ADG73841.1 DNA ligase I, ATP-dependent Dnl1 [Cellulomonas flavigena DSM 20109]